MPPTKQFTFRLPPDVAEFLQVSAKKDQRSLAFIVTAIVRAEMAREAKAKKAKSKL